MNKKCLGCGAILQTNNKDEIGYINKDKYEDGLYCERCFKIKNYNIQSIIDLNNINDKIIEEVNKNNNYVYFLIDFLNINEETINTFKKIRNNKTLIISKIDYIPYSISFNLIKKYLLDTYKIQDNIIFISSKKNIHLEEILSKEGEIYILGYTNSGKSTLINKLLQENNLTISINPNTTLDFNKIKINDKLTLIDSPGFNYQNTLYTNTEYDLIKKLNPKKHLKPRTYQVKKEIYFNINNKILINTSTNNSFTFYIGNEIKIDKEFINNKNLSKLSKTNLNIEDNTDLVIKSLGFINIKKKCNLTIYINDINLIEIRKSLFSKE